MNGSRYLGHWWIFKAACTLNQMSFHKALVVVTSAGAAEGVLPDPVVSLLSVVTVGEGVKEMGKDYYS